MRRQITIHLLLLTTCLTSCVNTAENKIQNTISSVQVDTSIIAIIPFDTSQCWVFKTCKPTELSNLDLKYIERILEQCIDKYNHEQEKLYQEMNTKYPNDKIQKKHYVIDLKLYKRQYIAVINETGEKEVWVNCFCENWPASSKKDLVFVEDGGNCYFNLKVNLTTGKYYELMVNGYA